MSATTQRAPLLADLRTRLRLSLAATMAVRHPSLHLPPPASQSRVAS
jgi:hypothetical protein